MKRLFTVLAFASLATMTYAQSVSTTNNSQNSTSTTQANPADDPNAPDFQWVEETHDFGSIPQGKPATWKFEFTNSGKEPLIISNVQKTCGCTVTDWTKEPVMPGQKGFVSAQYNAAHEGPFTKAITVQSNAKTPNMKLIFKGTVEKADDSGNGVPEQQTIFNSNGNN